MQITGVIQAGGRSTRMGGEPKALMDVAGKRIVERVADTLAAVLDDLLIVTNTPERYEFLHLPMVADRYPDGGALGGIFSGLAAARGDGAFTVACDMPFLHPDVVRLVLARSDEMMWADDHTPPVPTTQCETMHALYARACLGPMQARLRAGQLKIVGFFPDVRVLEIASDAVARHRAPEIAFMNVNTPDELAKARALAAEIG